MRFLTAAQAAAAAVVAARLARGRGMRPPLRAGVLGRHVGLGRHPGPR